jgi:hypothetical protein
MTMGELRKNAIKNGSEFKKNPIYTPHFRIVLAASNLDIGNSVRTKFLGV